MTYPWAGFSTFQFQREEFPPFGSDSGWGQSVDTLTLLPIVGGGLTVLPQQLGRRARRFETYMAPDRYDALVALLGTTGLFVDFNRPVPDSRTAILVAVDKEELAGYSCGEDDDDKQRFRVQVSLIDQS